LIKRGNVFIAQPPLYGIRKGKTHQYIKNEREFVRVMVKRASEGIIVRYGEGAAKLEGAPLTKFFTTLKEYLEFYDKVDKRLRDDRVTDLLPQLNITKKSDFEGDPNNAPASLKELESKLKAIAKERQFHSVELRFDEEHDLWEAIFVNAQGAEHRINAELASAPEYKQMMAKYKQIAEYMQPPFVVEFKTKETAESAKETDEDLSNAEKAELEKAEKRAGAKAPTRRTKAESEVVEKTNVRDLFEYVLNEGRKDFTIQRYKGLGEMSSEQLWQTTMDPEKRTLLQVKLEDITETENIFTTLMGDDVESRRKFIEDNALDVKNLDI
jgi:DNA gyrase subunit B